MSRHQQPQQRSLEQATGHRLFIGSIPGSLTQAELKAALTKYGALKDIYYNADKHFSFVSFESPEAVSRLLGQQDTFRLKGASVQLRRAAHKASVFVSDLNRFVCNEILGEAFSQFGEVERAVVVCDERGFSLGHGIVEFARKRGMQKALQECSERPFLIARFPKPVAVKPFIHRESRTGFTVAMMRTTPQAELELSLPPRFPPEGSWESTLARQWQGLQQEEAEERTALEKAQQRRRLDLEEQTRQAVAQEMNRAAEWRAQEERRRAQFEEEERRRAHAEQMRREEEGRQRHMAHQAQLAEDLRRHHEEQARIAQDRADQQARLRYQPEPAPARYAPHPAEASARPHPYARNGYTDGRRPAPQGRVGVNRPPADDYGPYSRGPSARQEQPPPAPGRAPMRRHPRAPPAGYYR